jgi:hypothetical protein
LKASPPAAFISSNTSWKGATVSTVFLFLFEYPS